MRQSKPRINTVQLDRFALRLPQYHPATSRNRIALPSRVALRSLQLDHVRSTAHPQCDGADSWHGAVSALQDRGRVLIVRPELFGVVFPQPRDRLLHYHRRAFGFFAQLHFCWTVIVAAAAAAAAAHRGRTMATTMRCWLKAARGGYLRCRSTDALQMRKCVGEPFHHFLAVSEVPLQLNQAHLQQARTLLC
jgi:hypothetical protein